MLDANGVGEEEEVALEPGDGDGGVFETSGLCHFVEMCGRCVGR